MEKTAFERREGNQNPLMRTLPEIFSPEYELNKGIKETAPENENSIDRNLNSLQEILKESEIEMSPEDFKELQEIIPELFERISPEFGEYLKKYNQEIYKLMNEIQVLTEKKDHYATLDKMTDFLEKQMKEISKIQDPHIRATLRSYIGAVLNIEKIEKDLSARLKTETMSAGMDCVPILGSAKMLIESGLGKKMTGERLTKKQALTHGAAATALLALDTVGIAAAIPSAGTSLGASQGVRITATGVSLASKGVKLAKSVSRFSALIRATTKSKKGAVAIRNMSKLINKYPRLSGAIVKLSEKRVIAGPPNQIMRKTATKAITNMRKTYTTSETAQDIDLINGIKEA